MTPHRYTRHTCRSRCLARALTLAIAPALAPLHATAADASATAPSADPTLPAVRASAGSEPRAGKDSLRATSTSIGKGTQALRDVPQSLTVVTERLIDDRNLDTLKDALALAGGVAFQAPEGGEEDIRLRGFSLAASGDIFIDGLRDPAFYERDSFTWDRLEVLRGSASMLFGRGSTGGVVNQVSKQPTLFALNEVALTLGSGAMRRLTADLGTKIGEDAALRVNAMAQRGNEHGLRTDKRGIAPTLRWGIGQRHEFSVGLYHLDSDNGIHYGLPWLVPGTQRSTSWLWPGEPKRYYGMASDRNHTGTTQAHATHRFKLDDGTEWRTQLRAADYRRDQRASAIHFAPASQQPGGQAVNADTFGDASVLTRGTNNKLMNLGTLTLQSDLALRRRASGFAHELATGIDASAERFENLGATLPAGTTLTKPVTRVGTPADGASVDESLRITAVTRRFRASALGIYAQDFVALTPQWKLLGGLRLDRVEGRYDTVTAQGAATNPCSVAAGTRLDRADTLWSRRLGVLYQPSPQASFHASYATSFNTSGDTYQFDAGTSRTPPEGSRNVELGARLDAANGRLTTRLALFLGTKTNERNRDADTVNACNYVLSGKRHAAGAEIDVAGRITPQWEVFVSYAFIPEAEVDASSGAAGTEAVGSRPGLTPRHSGSVWTTWRIGSRWRVGAGLTARSSDRPVGLATTSTIAAPGYATTDLMAEYTQGLFTLKANLLNLADRHVAETLYRGHYVPAKGRTLQLGAALKFF